MPEDELFGKQSRLVSPTERTSGIKSSVLIFFCSINDNVCSGWLGSTLWSSELLTTPTSSKETGGKSKSIERWGKKINSWGTLGRDENGNISEYKSKKLGEEGISCAAVKIEIEKTSLQRFGFHLLTDNFLEWYICIQLASIWSTPLIPKLQSYKR